MQRLRLQDRLVLPELNTIGTGSAQVHVEPKVMAVLLELVKCQGEIVSKARLMESVWGGVFVCEDVVTNAVSMLRRALGDDAKRPALIQTISKRGYRLLSPAIPEPAEPDAVHSGARSNDLARSILRARYMRHEETIASLTTACSYCEEIIRQEPNCAAVYSELALSLFLLEKLGAIRREDSEPKVRAAVDRALCLDEHASMTLVCLAKLEYRYEWRWDNAALLFQKATQANPFEADAFTESSTLVSVMRRFDEGLEQVRRACLLDPLSPSARLQAGHINYSSGRWADAAAHYERLLRFTPQHVFARWGFADSLIQEGKLAKATAVLSGGASTSGGKSHPLLATSLLRARKHGARQGTDLGAWDDLRQQTNDPMLLAELYISMGEMTRAFAQLNAAADLKHYRIAAVNMFPQFGPLRGDRRYRRLLDRIGLRH